MPSPGEACHRGARVDLADPFCSSHDPIEAPSNG
jgi:hypothetical protein